MLQPPERTVGGSGGGLLSVGEPIDGGMLEGGGGGRHGQASSDVMTSGMGREVMARGQRAAGLLRTWERSAHAGIVNP